MQRFSAATTAFLRRGASPGSWQRPLPLLEGRNDLHSLLLSSDTVKGGQASAACDFNLIQVDSWSIKPVDERTNELKVTIKSHASKPIQMLDPALRSLPGRAL